ncbi:hypothetical protein Ddc_17667 [Ditylenchus destructor]|nr:hypothetical protein Ddc_17667 [Ditylenchus destructor]
MYLGDYHKPEHIWQKARKYRTDITEIKATSRITGRQRFEIKSDRSYLDIEWLTAVYISTEDKMEVELIDEGGNKYYVELGKYAFGMYIWEVITKAYPTVTQIRTKSGRTGSRVIYGTVITHPDEKWVTWTGSLNSCPQVYMASLEAKEGSTDSFIRRMSPGFGIARNGQLNPCDDVVHSYEGTTARDFGDEPHYQSISPLTKEGTTNRDFGDEPHYLMVYEANFHFVCM